MADTEKKVKITIDADEATKQLNEIKEALAATQKELADLQESSKKTEKATSNIAGGFKSIGNALKGLGIVTIVVSAFSKLKEIFMSNQKVAESVNTVMNFVTLTFQKVVEVVVAVVEKVSEMSQKMDGTKAVISDLIKIALTPLKLEFYAVVLGVKSLILGWTQLFDKKNTEKIKSLTDDVAELKDKLKETAVGAVDAAKDFGQNIGKAVTEVGNVVKETGKIIKKGYDDYDAQETMNQAKRLANAKEFYGNMAIQAQKEIDSLEAISEKHRQDRDDTNKSFEERKKANEELIASNEAQYQAALKLAEAHISEAKANAAVDNSIENRLAVQTALAEKEKAYADLQGKISEQKAAALGLTKEEIDAQNALTKTQTDASFSTQKLKAQTIKDFDERIAKIKEISEAEYQANKKILDDKLASLAEGSAAWYTAKQEEVTLEQQHAVTIMDIQNQVYDHQKELDDNKKEQDKKDLEDKKAIRQQEIDIYKQSFDAINQIAEYSSEYKQNLLQKQLNQGEISQEQFDKKTQEIEIKAAKRKKAMAIIGVTISAAEAIMNIWAKVADPTPVAAFKVAQTVAVGALAAAQIAAISSQSTVTSTPSINASSGDGGNGTAPTTSFSFAESPKTPEIQPARTYVVSKEVTTQQQLDRQIISNGTL